MDIQRYSIPKQKCCEVGVPDFYPASQGSIPKSCSICVPNTCNFGKHIRVRTVVFAYGNEQHTGEITGDVQLFVIDYNE
jgi:hypothetical protein